MTDPRFAFVLRRVLSVVPLLLGITFLVVALRHVTPGDPARLILGPRATNQEVAQLSARLGLDAPLPTQYFDYVKGAVTGNLGSSLRSGQPVTGIIAHRLPVTLWLLGAATVFSLLIGIPLGILAARFRDRAPDHLIRGGGLAALTAPPYWVGIMLIAFVALPTGLFPVSGFSGSTSDRLVAIVLPGLTLAIAMAPVQLRGLRAAMLSLRRAPFVDTVRSTGIRSRVILLRHELPNAVLPVVTLLALQVGYFLFGAVVVESTFALGGLGQAMVQAVEERDFTVVQGITLVFAVVVVLTHLLADVVTALVDPRVEMA